MESINIQTAQNIRFEQNLASLGQRVLAFLVDWLIVFSYAVLIIVALPSSLDMDSRMALNILLFLPGFLYMPLMEIFKNGQTVGKSLLQIRVVRLDGSAPTVSAYLLRWVLGLLEYYLSMGGIAFLAIAFSRHGQRLGDMAGGTTVVREEKAGVLQKRLAQMATIPEDYQPEFSAAIVLEDRDLRLAREALRAFRRDGNRQPMNLLQQKLAAKMEVDAQGWHPIKFLETLQKDYAYFSQREAASKW